MTERDWKDGPHRRHRWVLDIQAHTLEEFQAQMRHILFVVESKDHFPVIVSGGGYHCTHEEDPEMTPERWERELEEWVQARRDNDE